VSELLALPLTDRAWDPLPLDPVRLWIFSLALALWGLVTLALAWPRGPQTAGPESTQPGAPPGRLPAWGLWGPIALAGAALAALGGYPAQSQPLLVLGLALVLAADTERRTGSSLLARRHGWLLLLFGASAALGWLFYWLNLFLQLWTYPGAGAPLAFLLVRTLDYATLLPALMALRQWLASLPGLVALMDRGMPVDDRGRPREAWLYLGAACVALLGAAIWPDWIWAPAWMAPVLLVLGMQKIAGQHTLFASTRRGDWTGILLPGLAALALGAAIQGWNVLTGPVWDFRLPLIDGLHLFGLPLPAYAGLVPLGLLGLWVAQQLAHPWRRRGRRPPPFPVRISIRR
jgi:hypothetical protein